MPDQPEQDDPGKYDELVRQAKIIQEYINELIDAIRQGHQQRLKPEYIEEMSKQLAKLLKEMNDLFK